METIRIDDRFARIYYEPLPQTIHGVCAKESDNQYIIIINADMSDEQQAESLQHEILHIKRKDFDRTDITVEQIEINAHREIANRKEA